MQETVNFSSGTVDYYFDGSFALLDSIAPQEECIIITDHNVGKLYKDQLADYPVIILPAGEQNKTMQTILSLADQLIEHEAHRKTFLIGLGGGTITDMVGFMAAIYMRGIACGFIPTTLLAMVDAAIGGKNGIDYTLHKNLLGTVRQPRFILQDTSFLQTLPDSEWSNGFAEIIKYACLFDSTLFHMLQEHDIAYYKTNSEALNTLVTRCTGWKNKIVVEDELEAGPRKLLNFGHTAGHAIETVHNIPHGQAVALGMLIACMVSEQAVGLSPLIRQQLENILKQYQLPTTIKLNSEKVIEVLRMDKKRNQNDIDYIVLQDIGQAAVKTLSFDVVDNATRQFADAANH